MAGPRPNGANRQNRRRWTFGTCVFDEFNWTLVVDGRRVPVEAKPLELLRELLMSAGDVVSKDDLLDRIWPDVTVVEASLPTAVGKLRRALGDDRGAASKIIETVPGIGYRLSRPVNVEEVAAPAVSTARSPPAATANATATPPAADRGLRQFAAAFSPRPGDDGPQPLLPSLLFFGGGLAILLAVATVVTRPARPTSERPRPSYTQRDAANALRKLDVGSIEKMLAAGWNPNTPFDREENGAVNYVLNICEWNRGHDQEQLLLMVRTLFDGGARLEHRNIWGDTAYSIAKAQRYCGPDHPVTRSIRTMCYAGYKPIGDRCLATYELARREAPDAP